MKLNSLSPFWLKFDGAYNLSECSEYFQSFSITGLSFLDILSVKQPKLNLNNDLFSKLDRKLILFYIKKSEIKFRGTIHQIDDGFAILAWPAFQSIDQIKKYKLSQYMRHPACSITDTLILKDVLSRSKEKVHQLKIKKIEAVKDKEISRQSNIAKAQFLANMSHEIRTPLNGMLGMIELLQDTKLEQDQVELIKVLAYSGENLLKILNDILDFSKIDANKIIFEKVTFNFVEQISGVLKLLEYEAKSKEIYLNFNYDDSIPRIYVGDPVRVTQVISNLISNAIKFTHEGGVDVNLSILKNNMIQIVIKDTGIGISDQEQKNLFSVFTQADASTTRNFGGTGLGLVIAKRLVVAMGGDIKLDSVVDVGTTFTINLNLEHTKKDSLKSISLESGFSFMDSELGVKFPMKILVAEDNDVNTLVIKMMLAKLGYKNCHFVCDGEEVLTKLRETEVDGTPNYCIILMDIQMPNLDGLEATKLIKKKYGKSSPAILAVTANAYREELDKCICAGMDDYITKPLSAATLKSALYTIAQKINK